MAYTTQQLVTAYTNANLGKTPDTGTTLILDAYATQSQTGGISDTVALANTLKLVNNTTAVAIETYQFFTNRAPSVAGLTYLVNSATNTADLNDAYYAKFGQENRFINFAINLATGSGEGAAAFALAYGNTSTTTVTFEQTVATAYDKIIGNAVAAAAGVDVAATVKFFSRADNITYLTNFVKANTGLTAAADIDLAVKAALIGEILNAATVNNIGGYAAATAAMLADLSDGVLSTDTSNGVNIITSYPGTGTVGQTFNLTASIDTLTGTNANDTFNGIATATAGSATVNLLDSIDGGAGNDTLNLSNAGISTDLDIGVLSVKNVETVNFTSVSGLAAGAADFSSWTGLQAANISLAAPGAAQAVTVATTTNANLTVAKVGANAVSLQGGKDVVVTTTGGTGGTLSIGTTTAVVGNLTASATGAYTDGANTVQGAISVKGGVNVSVTEATGITAAQSTAAVSDATNFTVTQGAITVTGTSATKSVTVSQAAANAGALAATQESAAVTTSGLVIGQSVSLAGLTFTATAAVTANQLAAIFGSLADGATSSGAGAGLGNYSGALTGYSTGAAAGNAVTFTATALGNAPNVVSSDGSAATVVVTAGVNGRIGVVAGAVTITDVNAASATTAGTIGTISLTNSTAAITANAVTSLTLNDSTATLTANTGNALVNKSLALTVSGSSSLTDANNEISTITVSNSSVSDVTIADTGLTALNVAGSKGLTLNTPGALTALKTVTVTGAGGLTANLSGLGAALTKVDTTGSTGASVISISAGGAAATAFAGGAGSDTVTLVGATPTGSSISLGGGDDRLLGTTAVAVSTTSVIDGGAGIDAVASTLINSGNAAQFKNFEVLNLAETAGTFDVALLTGSTITTLELNGGAGGGTYANVGLNQSVSVTGNNLAGGTTLVFGTAASGTTDSYTIGFNAVSTGTTASPATVAAGPVSIDGIENVKITSGAAAGVHTNTITLADSTAQTLTVTGSNAISLAFNGFGSAGTTGLNSIDASAATGVVTVSLANTGLIGTGLALKTGSGADVITVGNIGATGAVTITTGGGKDSIDVSLTTGIIGAGATAASHVTFTDLSAGDKITFANHGVETFTSAKIDVSTANDFADALNQATQVSGAVNSVISWFQYGGNTYIVENNDGVGFGAADIVVKLTGTATDLSTALLSNSVSGTTGPSLTLV